MQIVNNQQRTLEVFGSELGNQTASTGQNRLLWLAELEKNNLYSSLAKFKIVTNANFPTELEQSNGSEQPPKIQFGDSNAENLEKINDPLQTDLQFEADGTKPSKQNPLSNKVEEGMQDFPFLSIVSDLKRGITLESSALTSRSVLQQSLIKSQWISKNILVTTVNTNTEVWVRDNSLNQARTMEMLKNLKDSMAKLGINLVKVAINGQVMLEK